MTLKEEYKPPPRRKFRLVRKYYDHDTSVFIEDEEIILARNYTTTHNGDVFFIDHGGILVAAKAAGAWESIYNEGEIDESP